MSTKLFTFATLLALTAALPSAPRNTLTERQNTECWQTNPGTTFYRCSNGYVGCFASDPCSLPPIPKKYEITKPRSYNIYPLSEAQHDVEDRVGHVDLNKPEGSRTTTTNAMVFDNVPAGAKNCQLKWRSTKPNGDNAFTVSGSGAAFTRQLTGFPSENVSFNSLKGFQDPNADWSPSLDFTGWPESPSDHNGPALKCGEQVALEIKGSDEGEGENRVFITLTETNGFYLSYEL